jgi:hypothetical protein
MKNLETEFMSEPLVKLADDNYSKDSLTSPSSEEQSQDSETELEAIRRKLRANWRPASTLDVTDKNPNMGYRYVVNEEENIRKKKAEGWEFVNKTTGITGDPNDELHSSDGAKRHRELVLMANDKKVLEARAKALESTNRRSEAEIFNQTQRDLGPARRTDGRDKIVIE